VEDGNALNICSFAKSISEVVPHTAWQIIASKTIITWINMVDNLRPASDGGQPWMADLQKLIAYGEKARALKLLEKVIEQDMPLFQNVSSIQESRHIAWLYRIDLLRDWGRRGL